MIRGGNKPCGHQGKSIGSRSSKCKGPEAGKSLECVRDAQRWGLEGRGSGAVFGGEGQQTGWSLHVLPMGPASPRILFSVRG